MARECWWCGREAKREWSLCGLRMYLCDADVPYVFDEMRRRGLPVTMERLK